MPCIQIAISLSGFELAVSRRLVPLFLTENPRCSLDQAPRPRACCVTCAAQKSVKMYSDSDLELGKIRRPEVVPDLDFAACLVYAFFWKPQKKSPAFKDIG